MTDQYTKDKRYRITHYITKDFGSYFESDTRWEWEVTDTKTKKRIITFSESDFENAGGREESGASSVAFSPDEEFLLVEYHGGKKAKIPFKAKIKPLQEIRNKDKKFILNIRETLSDDGGIDTSFALTDSEGAYIDIFTGKNAEGKKTGTKNVKFSSNGNSLLIENYDGTKQTRDLNQYRGLEELRSRKTK